MTSASTFERVYDSLKELLRAARFAPGDRLEPASLSADLNASVTPVRDALHRLVGERLVEAPRHEGFRVPRLTEISLRHLYDWNSDLLSLALRHAGAAPAAPDLAALAQDETPERLALATADLFLAVAHRSGNPEHIAAIANVNERLSALRLVESECLDDVSQELRDLTALCQQPEVVQLRRAIGAYHRRRRRAAPDLLEALYSRAASKS